MPKPVQASTYNFRDIIENGFLYVDKTRHLYELVRYGKGLYFLARPRRFGKSLLLSTLAELFHGNKELFQGLWIYDSDYKWQAHPIIHIDFSRYQIRSVEELHTRLKLQFFQIAQEYQIELDDHPLDVQWVELIMKLSRQQRPVILIDEYDKPILDNIHNIEEAKAIRDTLKGFYGSIKSLDAYHRFVFITGLSKFSRVGIFSNMNNLDDLTMNPRFATLLGLTEAEMGAYFAEHTIELAAKQNATVEEIRARLREWYDGFCFVETCESVYNPYSTLQLFHTQRFANYWFETGTPTFLMKLLKEQEYEVERLYDLRLRELAFSTYDFENLAIIPLLFQTGYLTIKHYEPERRLFTLGYPNFEVEDAFLTYLLAEFNERERSLNEDYLWDLIDALETKDLDAFFTTLQVFFAQVPYNIHLKHEKYYQTIFYLIFKLIGLRIEAEVHTNRGRIDAVLDTAHTIFLFEFKLDESAEVALQQIKTHEYYQKYHHQTKPLILIGANFDTTKRQVSEWRQEAG